MPIKEITNSKIDTVKTISQAIAEAKLHGQSSFTTQNWEGKPCRVVIRVVDIPEEQAELKRKTVKDIFERKFADWFREEYLPKLNRKGGEVNGKTDEVSA